MFIQRRALPILMGLSPLPAAAQPAAWPNRALRLVVPFPPGGTQDMVARLLQAGLAERLGQAVVVDNRPGAGALIGTDWVAKAPADGHTILLAANSFTINAALVRTPPFDARQDFVAVANLGGNPHMLIGATNFRPATVADVVVAARAAPGRIAYGSPGLGTAPHMTGEAFKQAAGIDLTHVPYRGGAPQIQDVVAGHLPLAMVNLSTVVDLVRDGRVKGIAIASAARHPALPALPSFAEAGYQAVNGQSWYGLVVRTGTPEPVLQRLHEATNATLAEPAVLARLAEQAVEARPMTRAQFAEFLAEEFERNARIVRDGGITAG